MIRFLPLFVVSFLLTACGEAKIEVPKDSDSLRKQQEESQNKAADEERAMQRQMQKN